MKFGAALTQPKLSMVGNGRRVQCLGGSLGLRIRPGPQPPKHAEAATDMIRSVAL